MAAAVRLLAIEALVIEAGGGRRPATRLVDGLDLSVARGEVVGIVGESGAGKSSVGLAALGHVRDGCRFAAGTVSFDGEPLIGASRARLSHLRGTRIAYVAQSAAASFNPAHRLIDQCIEAPLRERILERPAAERAAVEFYRRLRLPEPEAIGFRYPHQVSGGQLQRAMTAMAMIARPDLIVFDEPTTALDVTTQIEVLVSIRAAVRDLGAGAIYISHDLAVVAQMADRVVVMRHGRIEEEGDTRRMLAAPRSAYTRSLWAVRRFRAPEKPPVAGAEPVLEVKGVSAAYGRTTVLDTVSFHLHRGRTLAIVGESGSGKSTLARVIVGLLEPVIGSVSLAGRRLAPRMAGRPRADLRAVQLVFQSPDTALNPRRTVGDEIARPLALFQGKRGSEARRTADALMRAIELDPESYRDRRLSDLSGGQKQRVAIARALAAGPEVLVCDEVTSALDQLVAEEVLGLIARLQRELGLAILFITHDIATVRAIADDVLVMQAGRVVRSGTKAQVFEGPFDPYTETLFASVPEMDPDWLDRRLAERARAAAEAGRRTSA